MSDPNLPPPSADEPPTSWPPSPPPPGQMDTGAPSGPPPGPPTGPPGAPPAPYGAPAPAPGQWAPPPPSPPGQWGAPPPGYQPAAQPYQYGMGAESPFPLAAPGRRIVGRILDWLIMAAVIVPIYIAVIALSAPDSTTTSNEFGTSDGLALGGFILIMLLATVGQVLYEVVFVALKGQTPGAMIVKVRIVREADGQIPGWGPAIMRWVPNLVSLVPCLGSFLSLGLWIWALVNLFSNPKRQTPFDLAAKTVVVDARQG